MKVIYWDDLFPNAWPIDNKLLFISYIFITIN